mmetsp:Transcript_135606/g.249434  ORF Transcript_135606/g.249434 Transcript_135606/m.249434 type:complete len:202 (-) Transcript_135606:749-1354(-)
MTPAPLPTRPGLRRVLASLNALAIACADKPPAGPLPVIAACEAACGCRKRPPTGSPLEGPVLADANGVIGLPADAEGVIGLAAPAALVAVETTAFARAVVLPVPSSVRGKASVGVKLLGGSIHKDGFGRSPELASMLDKGIDASAASSASWAEGAAVSAPSSVHPSIACLLSSGRQPACVKFAESGLRGVCSACGDDRSAS